MLKRMLRHRLLQQCARLALGIRPPEFQKEVQGKQIKAQTIEQAGLTSSASGVMSEHHLVEVDGLRIRLMGSKPNDSIRAHCLN